MAQGMTGSAALGVASARISIDTSDLARMNAVTAQAGQAAARNLGVIDGAAKRASQGVSGLTSSLGGMLGAFGIATAGAALVAQLARLALQSDATATAYRRQNVAALDLAGSQGQLTALLNEYAKATGNQIDKAQALADVTRLQAIGFADSAAELNEFVTAARGAALALGSSQEYIIGQVQLAIANQSTMRLDQIGLGVVETETRIKALKAANGNLTNSMAYQNAVLGLLTEKYGKLATSLEAQATGAEKAAKAWKDLKLEFGESLGPAVGGVMEYISKLLDEARQSISGIATDLRYINSLMPDWAAMPQATAPLTPTRYRGLEEGVLAGRVDRGQQRSAFLSNNIANLRADGGSPAEIAKQEAELKAVNRELAMFRAQLMRISLVAGDFSRAGTSGLDLGALPQAPRRGAASGPSYTDNQTKAIQQWSLDVQAIEREAGTARVAATRQYEQQRAETIADYGRQVVREEADFARNRTRAIADYAKAVADAQADAAESEADAARDYARAVANIHEDAGKRDAKWQRDYNERIAELRSDGNARLVELEADYAKNRERAELDHRDRLLSAAARLDAVGVFEEQRNYARQQKDAEDNYSEQRTKIQKALDEQVADALESHQERLQDSREADAERLADLQQSFEEQRAETRADAAQRLKEMQEDFDERLAQEDADRAVANARRAEDHAAQLAQMATAQAERMAQIDEQVAKEKKALEEQFLAELEAEGLHNEQWLKLQNERQKASLEAFEKFWKEIEKKFAIQGPPTKEDAGSAWPESFADGGLVRRSGMALVHAGEVVLNSGQQRAMAGGMARNISIGDINVYGSPGMSTDGLAAAVRRELMAALEEAA